MRTSSPFPVYDRLVLSGALSLATRPAFIDASEAFDVLHPISKLGDLGPVAPPFDSVWVEGHDLAEDGSRPRVAMHVFGGGERYHVASYAILPSGVKKLSAVAEFSINPDGTVGEITTRATGNSSTPQRASDKGAQVLRAATMALFSISLMHCKNVGKEAAAYVPARRRKTSRQRPEIIYTRIYLPRLRGRSGGCSPVVGTQRLHKARGHFKTYTEEAPLMGKHVGTYYWGWQVRGKKENGEAVSSYKVGAEA